MIVSTSGATLESNALWPVALKTWLALFMMTREDYVHWCIRWHLRATDRPRLLSRETPTSEICNECEVTDDKGFIAGHEFRSGF